MEYMRNKNSYIPYAILRCGEACEDLGSFVKINIIFLIVYCFIEKLLTALLLLINSYKMHSLVIKNNNNILRF
jgi:hypothetical protein